jgi:predicted phage-related endonuclease
MRTQIIKPKHGSQEWLTLRWKDEFGLARISASVAAVVHNCHNFQTPADLATELLADTPPVPSKPTAAMERGNRFEPVLLEWASDVTGQKITTPDVMYTYSEDGVRLIATLDGIREDGVPVEVKTTKKRWEGKLPDSWYWQGVQQAICTDSPTIEWVIFDGEQLMHFHTQTVTSDEKQKHIDRCREFLSAIDNGVPPAGVVLEYKHASELFPDSDGATVELPAEAQVLLDQLNKTKEIKKHLDDQENLLKGDLGVMLGEAEKGTINGKVVVTWKTVKKDSFDMSRFESEHPALVAKYRKQSQYRMMKVTGGK